MGQQNAKRDQRFVTLRLFDEDRHLLQDLGRGRPEIKDRFEAMQALVKILPELDLEDVRNKERSPIRVGIPTELEDAINKVVERTGQPFLSVLLAAAREYRRRYPKA